MARITMAALISMLALAACKGPFGPDYTTYDPKTGKLVANLPDSAAANVVTSPIVQQPIGGDDDN